MKAYPYVVTLKTPEGPREVRVRAWTVPDALMQAALEVQPDYPAGSDIQCLKVQPDETTEIPLVLEALGKMMRGEKP